MTRGDDKNFIECLRAHAEKMFSQLDFDYYAICSIKANDYGVCNALPMVHVTNYPQEWTEHYVANQLHCNDPVMQFGHLVSYPTSWSSLSNAPGFSDANRVVLNSARDFNVHSGVCMSIHNLDCSLLLVSMASAKERELTTVLMKDVAKTGSSQADTISSGAGNDIIYAGSGDDTIIYTSGDDVIIGNNTGYNYGNDTLDLSQYTADQVSFRITGYDVFIDTPDGTIELDYQVVNELGTALSNIENIIFSDGTLDEAGIRVRAIADQASSGDDVITGSFQSDVITGGAGNDTLSGVSGSDTFVFAVGDGVDVITDYDATNDALEFTGLGFSDLTITQTGSDVLIEYGTGDQLTVTGSLVADFVVDEFVFA